MVPVGRRRKTKDEMMKRYLPITKVTEVPTVIGPMTASD